MAYYHHTRTGHEAVRDSGLPGFPTLAAALGLIVAVGFVAQIWPAWTDSAATRIGQTVSSSEQVTNWRGNSARLPSNR